MKRVKTALAEFDNKGVLQDVTYTFYDTDIEDMPVGATEFVRGTITRRTMEWFADKCQEFAVFIKSEK